MTFVMKRVEVFLWGVSGDQISKSERLGSRQSLPQLEADWGTCATSESRAGSGNGD